MSKKDEMIKKCASDLKEKVGINPDMNLLTKITTACGPSIYNDDGALVSATSKSELETVKQNFLINTLGLDDKPELMDGVDSVMDQYGKSNRNKYRPAVYYLLTRHFKKESVFA